MSREKQNREMYNKELKTNFIRSYTKSIHTAEVAQNIFEILGQYEKEWEADICTRSTSELQPAIDSILGLRTSSKWMGIIMLREYCKWCMLSKYPGACDGIMGVNTVGLEKIKKQMVSGPLHLQKYFDEVFDAESEETIDNIYRCYLWMAYGGMPEDDALSIRIRDVNLDTLRIVNGKMEIPIYREALPAFQNAMTLTEFVYKHPKYPIDKIVRRNRILDDTIMRGMKANIKQLTLRSTLSKRFSTAETQGLTKQQLSFYRIWLSGVFYRTYEMERAGLPINFSEIAVKEMEGKTYTLSGRDSLRQKQNRKARDYAEDYQRWKLAFSI